MERSESLICFLVEIHRNGPVAIATHTSYTDYGLESSPKYSEIDDTLVFRNRSCELFTLRTLLLDGNDVPRTNQSMYVQSWLLVS